MKNEKSNLPKNGWIIGHIDLSALNQTCRPSKKIREEIRRITDAEYQNNLKEIKNDLSVLIDEDFTPRTLDFFQSHPLLQLIVPVLKERVQTYYLSVELFIEIALLLSQIPSLEAKDIKSLINDTLCRVHDIEESQSHPMIPQEDFKLLDELRYLLSKYSSYKGNVRNLDRDNFEWQSLISRDDFLSVNYEELHVNKDIYENKISQYFHFFKLGSLILPSYFSLYRKVFTEDYQVENLYDELCVKGNVVEVVTESGKISRKAVLDRMDYPLALCYIIALDKLTASGTISDKWIINNIDYKYIQTFRSLWWDCSVYAKCSEDSKDGLSFEECVQKNLTLAEMETGERLIMPDDYFVTSILLESMEVKKETRGEESKVIKETSETKTHLDNTTPKPSRIETASLEQPYEMPDNNVRKVAQRGRPSRSFRDCFYSNYNDVQDKYIEEFKVIAKNGKGKKIGYMIAVAYDLKILKATPSFKEAQKELGDIGSESGYKKYKQDLDQKDREYEDIKNQLLKIKEEIGE